MKHYMVTLNTPKEINIPFNSWSWNALAENNKVCTSRSKVYGSPGDYFYPISRSKFIIQYVVKLPLWVVRNFLFKQEGANTPEEFEQAWDQIHSKEPYSNYPFKMVYVHFFKNPYANDNVKDETYRTG